MRDRTWPQLGHFSGHLHFTFLHIGQGDGAGAVAGAGDGAGSVAATSAGAGAGAVTRAEEGAGTVDGCGCGVGCVGGGGCGVDIGSSSRKSPPSAAKRLQEDGICSSRLSTRSRALDGRLTAVPMRYSGARGDSPRHREQIKCWLGCVSPHQHSQSPSILKPRCQSSKRSKA